MGDYVGKLLDPPRKHGDANPSNGSTLEAHVILASGVLETNAGD